MSMPRRITELADLANCMNWLRGRSSSEEYFSREERCALRSKPMGLFCERQAKDLHEYLFQIAEESGREVGKGFRGRDEGSFDGVFEKQHRRGSG